MRGFFEDSDGNLSSSRLALLTCVLVLSLVVIYLTLKGTIDAAILTVYAGVCTGSYAVAKASDAWEEK